MTISDYTFLITDLLTGLILDEVELGSMHWTEMYDRPGGGQATARFDDPSTTQDNYEAWQNAIWVVKDGDIRWGGFMGAIQPQGGTRVINIPLHGFEEYLRYQLVTGRQAMSVDNVKGPHLSNNAKTIRWIQEDQFEIISDLVKHGQRQALNQNIGLTVVWDALSGVLRDEEISQWEGKFVGERLEEMSDNINGFDWFYEYYWEGNNPRVRIKLKYPRGPRYTNIVFNYDQDPGKCNILEYDSSGGERPASRFLGLGEGSGLEMVYTYSSEVQPGNVNYDDIYSSKQVKDLATLIEQTDGVRQTRDKPRFTIKARLDQTLEPYYTEYRAGDAVNVWIDDGYVQIHSQYTVVSKDIVLSKEHDEDVTVNLLDVLLG